MKFIIDFDCNDSYCREILEENGFEIECKTFDGETNSYIINIDGFCDLERIQEVLPYHPHVSVTFWDDEKYEAYAIPRIFVDNDF